MKTDIRHKQDIETLVQYFYEQVRADAQLAPFFDHVNWDAHLPVMYDFWENTLFYTGSYGGNPMKIHDRLHQMKELSAADFDQWLHLFTASVDLLFQGERATLAKQRATSIATVMRIKILHTNPIPATPKKNDPQ